ncbi:MAG: hypothetical protein V3T77_09650, partial [Planctomycetota bacterium]
QALLAARERFLDLKGLIETLYADERRIQGGLNAYKEELDLELLPALRDGQDKNIERSERLREQLARGLVELPEAPSEDAATGSSNAAGPGQDEAAIQRQRLELAEILREQATAAMADAQGWLQAEEPPMGDLEAAMHVVERSVHHLQALRRLFFSIVELLRETAERQAELNDQTEDVVALHASNPDEAQENLGPLLPRQEELASIAGEISQALEDQSRQDAAAVAGQHGQAPGGTEEAKETTEKLARAAELVHAAEGEMQGALSSLTAEVIEFDQARTQQDTALQQLLEALQLLVPPQNQQQQQPQQQQQQQQQPQPRQDSAQMLQAVRDREAKRRRDKRKRQQHRMLPVEKDW